MHVKTILIAIVCLSLTIFLLPYRMIAEPLDNWFQRTSGSSLANVRFINGTFVAVAKDGAIFTSADAVSWQLAGDLGIHMGVTVNDIVYQNNTYYIVGSLNALGGEKPLVKASTDLQTWVDRDIGFSWGRVAGIAYGNGVFVALGVADSSYSLIATSSDGVTWSPQVQTQRVQIRGIAFGNNTFVAVGYGGGVITSTDGKNWVNGTSNVVTALNSVLYANNMFLAVGESGCVITSATGTGWTVRADNSTFGSSGTTSLMGAAYGDGTFMIVGYNTTYPYTPVVATSVTGSSWTIRNCGLPEGQLTGVAYANNLFVVCEMRYIVTSPDGALWSQKKRLTYPGTSLYGALHVDGKFFLGGAQSSSAFIMTLVEGNNTYEAREVLNIDRGPINGLAYGNGMYVAVGEDQSVSGASKTMIYSSADGEYWIKRSTAISNRRLNGVTYGNNIFVAVGTVGTVMTSPDGVNWTQRNSGNGNELRSVTFGNGVFVAAGMQGTVLASPDGITWVQRFLPTDRDFYSIDYGNSKFVAVGVSGTIATSRDTVDWTYRSISYHTFYNVVYGAGTFVVIGNGYLLQTITYGILTSQDGEQWTFHDSPNADRIAFGDSTFIAFSTGSNVFQSAPITASSASYTISGHVRNVYTLQPLQGAVVTAKLDGNGTSITATTDQTGYYNIPLGGPGHYSIDVALINHQLYSAPLPAMLTETNRTEVSDLYMDPVGGLSGNQFTYYLSPGWNFISTPLQPSNTAIDVITQDIVSQTRVIWGYDNQLQEWKIWVPNATNNTLTAIESGKGYWIYMDSPMLFTVTGVLSHNPIHLYDGWNLVGYNGTDGAPLSSSMSQIGGKWKIAWNWESEVWRGKDDTFQTLPVPALSNFFMGKAYWIRIKPGMATDWTQ